MPNPNNPFQPIKPIKYALNKGHFMSGILEHKRIFDIDGIHSISNLLFPCILKKKNYPAWYNDFKQWHLFH